MKRLGLLIALVCISMTGFAQTQMAVLQHNDTITNIFYGTGAFVSAYNSAADGDIINLSGGRFKGCDVKKAITIRGAGARDRNGNVGTFFISKMDFESMTGGLSVEGVNFFADCDVAIHGTIDNLKFIKCIMKGNFRICNSSIPYTVNCNLINCLIEDSNINPNSNSNISIINCVLYSSGSITNSRIINSYVNERGTNALNADNSLFENCIFAKRHGESCSYSVSNSNTFVKCVAINMPNFYNNLVGGIGSNVHRTSMSEVFETFAGGGINYDEEYILNEDFATSFPGNDGTEVGIHGGMMPFSLDPSYMIVKRCNVAGKSTIDGKLSVDIEIETEE